MIKTTLGKKNTMIIKLIIIMVIFCFTTSNTVRSQEYSFIYDTIERSYLLHIPSSYNDADVPLIIAIHGWQRDPQKMEYHSHLSEKSDEEGFIVAYPKGTGNPLEWNTGEEGVDDAGFINALIDTLINHYLIDTNKIYLTGFSNGAEMTYKVAQKYGNRIAGIAPVACPFWDENNPPVKHMPIIHFHALNDGAVSYSTVQPVLDEWIAFNSCSETSETFYVVDGAYGEIWKDETGNADIVLFSTTTGSHSWPGGEISWFTPSQAISATDLLWDFFTGQLKGNGGTKVTEKNKKDINVNLYPNPATGNFILSNLNELKDPYIFVINQNGSIINSFEPVTNNFSVSAENLNSGIYFIKIVTRDQVILKTLSVIK